jgi:TonB family protein
MFVNFYKLAKQPFGETPDPRFIYQSQTHREAMASLAYGLGAGRGFLVLCALPGMGKTTLLFRLLEWLRGTSRTVFVFQTQCDSRDLLRFVLADLGIEIKRNDVTWMYEQLKKVLAAEAQAGRRLVLVIDEAQNLKPSVLESVRLLSDYENPTSKLIQIVLAGQPQLANKLARPELAQLRQRISIFSRLVPFTAAETSEYIDHRLNVAGAGGRRIFNAQARELIAFYTRGIPRNINMLCFNALSLGYALGKEEIDREIVKEAARDFELFPLAHEGASKDLNIESPLTGDVPPALSSAAVGPFEESEKASEAEMPMAVGETEKLPVEESIVLGDIAEPKRDDVQVMTQEGSATSAEPALTWEDSPSWSSKFRSIFSGGRRNGDQAAPRKPHYWQNAIILALLLGGVLVVGMGHFRRVIAKAATLTSGEKHSMAAQAENSDEISSQTIAPPTSLPASDSSETLQVPSDGVVNVSAKKATPSSIDVDNTGLAKQNAAGAIPVKANIAPAAHQTSATTPSASTTDDFFPPISTPLPAALPSFVPESGLMVHSDAGVASPRILSKEPPIYPFLAMQKGVQGQVIVDLIVDSTGRPTNPKAVSGPQELQRAAVEAVSAWQFAPASLLSRPVPVEMLVPVDFKLRSFEIDWLHC